MKSYTDLEQSKKLAEFLPLESADMYWWSSGKRYYIEAMDDGDFNEEEGHIRAWSLAALLRIIPKHIKDYNVLRIDISENDFVIWYDELGCGVNMELPDIWMKEPVDSCVKMILKLHKQKLL